MKLINALLTSKKFLVLLAGLASWLIGKLGLDIPTSELMPLVALISSYVIGQGIADLGKEASKVNIEAAKQLAGLAEK